MRRHLASVFIALLVPAILNATPPDSNLIAKPEAFQTLVNPNCSHCVDEAKRRANDLRATDPVLCWTRGYSEGGAIPIRFFLNTYRVISDSYGVFVYDPDAGYVRGFAPSYRFSFHGWRNGVMVMKHQDGTLYSCLSGIAFDGPRKGERLVSIPTLASTWGQWMRQYPNAVAYHMFEKYQPIELPSSENPDSVKSRLRRSDSRLEAQSLVLGVFHNGKPKAYPLSKPFRLLRDAWNQDNIVILRDRESVAAYRRIAGQPRKYKGPQPNSEGVSPPNPGTPLPTGTPELPKRAVTLQETPSGIIDQETGSTWDVAGRGQAGELKGWTLEPVDAVVCKWFAWSAEYPDTSIFEMKQDADKASDRRTENTKKTIKMVAGSAEFLRVLPKPFATIKAIDLKASSVTLLREGEELAKTWTLEPDAEIKKDGWWGRLEQYSPGDRVWVWFKLDRKKAPVSIAMLADHVSEFDLHGRYSAKQPAPPIAQEEIDKKSAAQRAWLRNKWEQDGLPGTLTFHHVFSGELEVMLDHEAMRWGRSLALGDVVHLTANPPIKGVVKHVAPWRERTLVRLVVGELESSELKVGQRIGLKVKPPATNLEDSTTPSDLDRPRSGDQRIEWFLASMYCACGVKGDICTGQFYTLASCNPNGCGNPNATRARIRKLIEQGKSDRQIWQVLIEEHGPAMLKPHLLP